MNKSFPDPTKEGWYYRLEGTGESVPCEVCEEGEGFGGVGVDWAYVNLSEAGHQVWISIRKTFLLGQASEC